MGNKIIDEFAKLPVSRQRKWQMRQQKKGLCNNCGGHKERYSHYCNRCMSKYLKRKGTVKRYCKKVKVEEKPKWKFTPQNDGARLLARLNMPEHYTTNNMKEGWTK